MPFPRLFSRLLNNDTPQWYVYRDAPFEAKCERLGVWMTETDARNHVAQLQQTPYYTAVNYLIVAPNSAIKVYQAARRTP